MVWNSIIVKLYIETSTSGMEANQNLKNRF